MTDANGNITGYNPVDCIPKDAAGADLPLKIDLSGIGAMQHLGRSLICLCQHGNRRLGDNLLCCIVCHLLRHIHIHNTGIGEIRIPTISLSHLGIEQTEVTTQESSSDAITEIKGAVEYVSDVRSHLLLLEQLQHLRRSLIRLCQHGHRCLRNYLLRRIIGHLFRILTGRIWSMFVR